MLYMQGSRPTASFGRCTRTGTSGSPGTECSVHTTVPDGGGDGKGVARAAAKNSSEIRSGTSPASGANSGPSKSRAFTIGPPTGARSPCQDNVIRIVREEQLAPLRAVARCPGALIVHGEGTAAGCVLDDEAKSCRRTRSTTRTPRRLRLMNDSSPLGVVRALGYPHKDADRHENDHESNDGQGPIAARWREQHKAEN